MKQGHFLFAATLASLGAPVIAQDFNAAQITAERIAEDFHVLFGAGGGLIAGNILVSIGAQGVLVVDTQFPEMAPKYKAAIAELGGGAIDFAINTHWHDDHAAGNKALGPDGTWLVAHENSRQRLTQHNSINLVRAVLDQPAYPAIAVPVASFDRDMQLHFNGEQIDLLHVGPAHTNGDTAVIFRGHNAVHLGDVFNNSGYPFVDADNGGSLTGIIEFCQAVLDEIDSRTVVVPGHGPIASFQDLASYIEMLTTIRDRIAALIADGASLEQVVAAKPTAEWDQKNGNPASFIDRSYTSLTR